VCEHQIEELNKKVEKVRYDVNTNETNIETKTKLIETIKKEGEIETIYKTYIEMTGKKGISKLVLRSVLPIINSELQRLLEGVTEFDVEVSIDDKNDVKISIVKDDIEKSLKSGSGYELTCSSIVLRCVLGKMSTLPMPNFIAFDEVLGRVADVNLESMKPLFDKIKDMFAIVLFITHNEIVKD
jgi:DNA repair exonuclease SbcCD ATPase subunit